MNNTPARTQAESQLAQILRDASGFDLYELNPDATFLELGFDSLFLIQFSQRIKSTFAVKVTFRQLIEEYSTIRSLVDFLAAQARNQVTAVQTEVTSPTSPETTSSAQVPEALRTASSNSETSESIAAATPESQPESSAATAPTSPAVQLAAPISFGLPSVAVTPSTGTIPSPVGFAQPLTLSHSVPMQLATFVPNSAPLPSGSMAGLEQIFSQQNQLMALQLQLLRERRWSITNTNHSASPNPSLGSSVTGAVSAVPNSGEVVSPTIANSATPASPAVASTTPANTTAVPTRSSPGDSKQAASVAQKKIFERFGPYKPVRKSTAGGLTQSQQQHLDQFIARFTQRTAKSRAHAQEHRDHFADPRGVAGYRRIWKSMVYQIAVERSAGSKLWDIDGNQYIDIAMGFGLNLFGQSPDFVTQALQEQLTRGVEVGPQSPLAGQVAKMLCKLSRMDRVTFCNTGSEAVMAAMRIARTVTGKTKVVFFNKDYHGNFDQVLLRSSSIANRPGSSPAAPGVPDFYASNTLVLEYGTEESLNIIQSQADQIAAILVEPVQSADPDFQPQEFMNKLREITRQNNIAMVMDEVISGFRAAPGGAQEYFNVWGDMATYGKVLGGGLPIGALAGKKQWMDALDGGTWRYEDDSQPEADMTFFAGTFVRHPLAMTAAYQILQRIEDSGPQLQQTLNQQTEAMTREINRFFVEEKIPIRLARFASLFRFIFPPDLEYADMLYFHLLDRGIFTRGWGDNCFLSTQHSQEDIQQIIQAVKSSCIELRQAGFLPEPGDDPSDQTLADNCTFKSTLASHATHIHASTPATKSPLKICAPSRISCIEEIQEEGDLPPLFCMPAADGLTLVYHELSNCLGKNQPMYGLNSPGVFGEPVPETIEEMAGRFVEDILEVCPDGPYLLTGYCSGGTIALEVAQQLIARGKQVAFLSGVETYNWGTAQSSQLTNWIRFVYSCQRFDFHFRNFWLLPRSHKREFVRSKLSALAVRTRVWRGMLANLWPSRKAKAASPRSAPTQINYADIWRQHDAQADRYRPKTYPGKMYLFRPKQDYRSYVAKVELQAEQGVEIIRLPVYPAGLMVAPFVAQLAELFEQGIREGLMELDAYPSEGSSDASGGKPLRLHEAV
jgi:glutamate-1-semialdehyde aminotransferase/thioesterase domain-containing protein/acyl carrier protein